MAMRSNANHVFAWIVDDVVAKVKPTFVQEGVEETVLDELRQTWEAKLLAQGLIGNQPAAAVPPGRHPNLGGHMGMGGAPRPPQPHMFPGMQPGAPGAPRPPGMPQITAQMAQQIMLQHMQQAAANRLAVKPEPGRPGGPTGTGPLPPAAAAAAVAAAAAALAAGPPVGSKRKEPEGGRGMPQHDGASDAPGPLGHPSALPSPAAGLSQGTFRADPRPSAPPGAAGAGLSQPILPGACPGLDQASGPAISSEDVGPCEEAEGPLSATVELCLAPGGATGMLGRSRGFGQASGVGQRASGQEGGQGCGRVPRLRQHDGPGDDGDDAEDDWEDVDDVAPPAQGGPAEVGKGKGKAGGAEGGGKAGAADASAGSSGAKEPVGDEVLSEDSEAEEEEGDISNFLCCQFEKVNRVKNKWKINMRDGVFRINGQDYLFKKGTGEWSWM